MTSTTEPLLVPTPQSTLQENSKNTMIIDGHFNHDNNNFKNGENSSSSSWEVHKFGGTSVASAKCIIDVACIIEKNMMKSEKESETASMVVDTTMKDPINKQQKQIAVVVSAMGAKKPLKKTTDLLLECVVHAASRESSKMEECLQLLKEKHLNCLKELNLSEIEQQRLTNVILNDINDIRDILKTVMLMKWQASRISELVSGYGELWSAQILTSLLQHRQEQNSSTVEHKFIYLDARRVITVEEDEPGTSGEGGNAGATGSGGNSSNDAVVCWNSSHTKLAAIMNEQEEELKKDDPTWPSNKNVTYHFVMTGYVAVNTQGVATTLSRDGSDYSAAILGRLLHAKSVTIWTDVNGVLSADPRRVPEAHVIPEVSYTEAMELAYFGAKVIHPKTMQPAIDHSYEDGTSLGGYLSNENGTKKFSPIPIWIRNTFEPNHPGSRIYTTSTTHTERDKCVCGFSTMDDMALINIEGTGMMGVHGVASRLFATLQRVKVNVVLIAQASSEHSITFACSNSNNQAIVARRAIEETFERELRRGQMNSIELIKPCSIIAAVGDGMSHTTGVSGLFFGALGDAKINLLAISQGCSERNISAVIHSSDSTRALRAVHAAFRLSHAVVRVGIVMDAHNSGNGTHFGGSTLGQSLLDILYKQRTKLRATFDIDLQVCVVCEATNNNQVDNITNGAAMIEDDADQGSHNERSYRLIVLDPEQRHKVLQEAVAPNNTTTTTQDKKKDLATGDDFSTSSSKTMVRNDSITPQDFAKFLKLSSDQEHGPSSVSDGVMTSPYRVVSDSGTVKAGQKGGPSLTTINSNVEGGVTITSHHAQDDHYHDVLSRQLLKYLVSSDCAHTVMFDCTAYEEVAKYHSTWLNDGVHVVTANSLGLSSTWEQRQEIDRATNKFGKHQSAQYLREVTAAGALPVISTLRDLLHSGDKVRRIDGILSVSLSYILHRISPPPGFLECEQFDQQFYNSNNSTGTSLHSRSPSFESNLLDLSTQRGNHQMNGTGSVGPGTTTTPTPSVATPASFHQAVTEAMDLGLMEHDPIKDLSNEYVARILMVLAKELGLDSPSLSVEQIQLESDMILSSVEQVLQDVTSPLPPAAAPSTDAAGTNEKNTTDNNSNHIMSGCVRKKTLKDGVMHYHKLSSELDVKMAERVARAASKGCVVRHVASIDVTTREVKVKLLDVPYGHLFATTPPSCAVVRFFTERHDKYPLVVQGPAEGAASTASALLAELLHMLRSKIAPKGGTLARAKPSGSYLSRMNNGTSNTTAN